METAIHTKLYFLVLSLPLPFLSRFQLWKSCEKFTGKKSTNHVSLFFNLNWYILFQIFCPFTTKYVVCGTSKFQYNSNVVYTSSKLGQHKERRQEEWIIWNRASNYILVRTFYVYCLICQKCIRVWILVLFNCLIFIPCP